MSEQNNPNEKIFHQATKSFLDDKNEIQKWLRSNNFYHDADVFETIMTAYLTTQQDYHKIATRYSSGYNTEQPFPNDQFPAHKLLTETLTEIENLKTKPALAEGVVSFNNNKSFVHRTIIENATAIQNFTNIINDIKLPEPQLITNPQTFDDKIKNFQETQKYLADYLKKEGFPDIREFNNCCNLLTSTLKDMFAKAPVNDSSDPKTPSKYQVGENLLENQNILNNCFFLLTNINHILSDEDHKQERKEEITKAARNCCRRLKDNFFTMQIETGNTTNKQSATLK